MSTTKHITEINLSMANFLAQADAYQGGIVTDGMAWGMADATGGGGVPAYDYMCYPNCKIAVSDGTVTYLDISMNDLSAHGNIYLGTNLYHNGDTDTKLVFGTNLIDLYAGGYRALTVDGSTGFVGVGIAAPAERLTIYHATWDTNIQVQVGAAAAGAGINFVNPTGGKVFLGQEGSGGGIVVGGTAYGAILATMQPYPLEFGTNSIRRAAITSTGDHNIYFPSSSGNYHKWWDACNNAVVTIESNGNLTALRRMSAGNSVVLATRASALSIANTGTTVMLFDTEVTDSLGEYSPTTGIFTASRACKVAVAWSVCSAAVTWVAGEYWLATCLKNSTGFCCGFPTAWAGISATMMAHGTVNLSLAANDTIKISVETNHAAGAVNTAASSTYNHLSIVEVP